ncbi:hypothetical protein AAHB54_12540, partial [Bacillus cereus]
WQTAPECWCATVKSYKKTGHQAQKAYKKAEQVRVWRQMENSRSQEMQGLIHVLCSSPTPTTQVQVCVVVVQQVCVCVCV